MLKLVSSSKSKSSFIKSYSFPIHFPPLHDLLEHSDPHSLCAHPKVLYSRWHSMGSAQTELLDHNGYGFFSSGFPKNPSKIKELCRAGIGFWRPQSLVGTTRSFSGESVCRESLNYDVVIVGAGPAGLSAAIRLKQLCKEKDVDLSVCVVEKGTEVGAHILSGNVFEPQALNELLPKWKQEEAPIHVPVSSDKFWLLSKTRAFPLPSPFNNRGNYVISLSQLVRWLGLKAEELGVEIYPGFAASEMLYDTNDKVIGIATNNMGVAKNGSKKDNFQPGVELKGRVTLLAEGCRGSLSEVLRKLMS